jgi:hypothetical protein
VSDKWASRFQTGDRCGQSGLYRFDGYTDGTTGPNPAILEREVPLDEGDAFPVIRSAKKSCWWILAQVLPRARGRDHTPGAGTAHPPC